MKKISLIIILILTSAMANAQTKIIAHRGFSSAAPENTLAAFQKAIELGADYFELDVHRTTDDSLMVIHDGTVDRTSSNSKTGEIDTMSYNEVSKVCVGYSNKFGDTFENEKIPTLREALMLAKGKIKVCIEIKVYGIENEVLKTINEVGVHNDVIIFSFYYPVLAKIRQLDSSIATLLLIDKADSLSVDYAKVIKTTAIGVGPGTNITSNFIENTHNAGVEVWKWTVNEEEEMNQLINLGIDGLITNFPDKAIKIRNSRN
ncbi:MAG: glycerophosphodiester phosphodiesterase [Bacteroidales bacterium]|nr:glycerophosphodiester phosphodiesterase [Bacteroidales bacterium]HPD95455.1 glycerophosphodiester phosphodiesterase family protein [Tenuifilaceae bacterium]HRX32552.1 glycerophosphodiester phosphodiesterase family protein [Tenuifilaceae bacterium]